MIISDKSVFSDPGPFFIWQRWVGGDNLIFFSPPHPIVTQYDLVFFSYDTRCVLFLVNLPFISRDCLATTFPPHRVSWKMNGPWIKHCGRNAEKSWPTHSQVWQRLLCCCYHNSLYPCIYMFVLMTSQSSPTWQCQFTIVTHVQHNCSGSMQIAMAFCWLSCTSIVKQMLDFSKLLESLRGHEWFILLYLCGRKVNLKLPVKLAEFYSSKSSKTGQLQPPLMNGISS